MLPSGSHYTLNIIGVPKGKTADMIGNNVNYFWNYDNNGLKLLQLPSTPRRSTRRVAAAAGRWSRLPHIVALDLWRRPSLTRR